MRIQLVALALATFDAFVLFYIRLQQVVDTSVWIALIAGVVGLLTLVIQTYAQIRMAKITKLASEIKEKQAEQAVDLGKVHTLVDGSNSKLLEELTALRGEVSTLKGAASERAGADAQAVTFAAGVKEGKGK